MYLFYLRLHRKKEVYLSEPQEPHLLHIVLVSECRARPLAPAEIAAEVTTDGRLKRATDLQAVGVRPTLPSALAPSP